MSGLFHSLSKIWSSEAENVSQENQKECKPKIDTITDDYSSQGIELQVEDSALINRQARSKGGSKSSHSVSDNPFPYLLGVTLVPPEFKCVGDSNEIDNNNNLENDDISSLETSINELTKRIRRSRTTGHTKRTISQHNMWEDSGYQSPALKSDGNQSQETEKREPAATLLSISQVTKQTRDLTTASSSTDQTRLEQQSSNPRINFGEKYVTTPIKSRPFDSYVQSFPLTKSKTSQYANDIKNQDYNQNSFNETYSSGLEEMMPAFTSTPIKSTTRHRNASNSASPASKNTHPFIPSFTDSNPNLNTGRNSSCSGYGGTGYGYESYNTTYSELQPTGSGVSINNNNNTTASFSSMLKDLDEDENINKIIQESSNEFHGKYSQWIAQIFNLQLDKIQRRLQSQFDHRLETVTKDKEKEILTMQQKFRNKLIEFESSTEKFQKWIETLADENTRVRETKDAIIAEMQASSSEQSESFRLEMEKQVNNVQAECEKEKLSLQRKHAEQLQSITEKSMGQVTVLEQQYQHQINTLQKYVTELKAQNEGLEHELVSFRKASEEQHSDMRSKYLNYSKDQEELLSFVNELRDKVSDFERQKEVLVAAHNSELQKTRAEAEKLIQNLSARMNKSQAVAEEVVKKYEEDVSRMKQTMLNQETQYKRNMDELKSKYGKRITELTKTVERLQYDLLGGQFANSSLL